MKTPAETLQKTAQERKQWRAQWKIDNAAAELTAAPVTTNVTITMERYTELIKAEENLQYYKALADELDKSLRLLIDHNAELIEKFAGK